MNWTQILMNKPVYLGTSLLEVSKIVIHDFWYHYVIPKYGEKAKLCYMDPDSLIFYLKKKDTDLDIRKNVETRFETSNYQLERPLPRRINKNVARL